ncbi:hypothetical protein BDZ45DRAFT_741434 [Acephala macrosclerotiorum]|nr:hypothetical protein BDZ45DRAFT_741434 [Acephala macrosclerotiorum]
MKLGVDGIVDETTVEIGDIDEGSATANEPACEELLKSDDKEDEAEDKTVELWLEEVVKSEIDELREDEAVSASELDTLEIKLGIRLEGTENILEDVLDETKSLLEVTIVPRGTAEDLRDEKSEFWLDNEDLRVVVLEAVVDDFSVDELESRLGEDEDEDLRAVLLRSVDEGFSEELETLLEEEVLRVVLLRGVDEDLSSEELVAFVDRDFVELPRVDDLRCVEDDDDLLELKTLFVLESLTELETVLVLTVVDDLAEVLVNLVELELFRVEELVGRSVDVDVRDVGGTLELELDELIAVIPKGRLAELGVVFFALVEDLLEVLAIFDRLELFVVEVREDEETMEGLTTAANICIFTIFL